MFEDYLSSIETYDKLEALIASFFNDHLKKTNTRPDQFITPHYSNTCSDGTQFRDANPIFSVIHISTGNVFRAVICDHVGGYSKTREPIETGVETCVVAKIHELEKIKKDLLDWIYSQTKK
ncbi:hypothetical protein [Pseudomonas cremoricolorata]|uniref:hypothetical protein n=1 Tax=Pseudomonas cremoricolorata TaxID=157783 RepID=UPI0012B5F583|nr:hypothetical protein [Pseudomonas cremoricolorata]